MERFDSTSNHSDMQTACHSCDLKNIYMEWIPYQWDNWLCTDNIPLVESILIRVAMNASLFTATFKDIQIEDSSKFGDVCHILRLWLNLMKLCIFLQSLIIVSTLFYMTEAASIVKK